MEGRMVQRAAMVGRRSRSRTRKEGAGRSMFHLDVLSEAKMEIPAMRDPAYLFTHRLHYTLHAVESVWLCALGAGWWPVSGRGVPAPRSLPWSHARQSAADLTFSLRLLRGDEPIDRTEVRARGGDDDVGRGPRATVLDGLDRSAHAILRLVHRHARAAREVEWQRGT